MNEDKPEEKFELPIKLPNMLPRRNWKKTLRKVSNKYSIIIGGLVVVVLVLIVLLAKSGDGSEDNSSNRSDDSTSSSIEDNVNKYLTTHEISDGAEDGGVYIEELEEDYARLSFYLTDLDGDVAKSALLELKDYLNGIDCPKSTYTKMSTTSQYDDEQTVQCGDVTFSWTVKTTGFKFEFIVE